MVDPAAASEPAYEVTLQVRVTKQTAKALSDWIAQSNAQGYKVSISSAVRYALKEVFKV